MSEFTAVLETPVAVDDAVAEGVAAPVANTMRAKALFTAVSDVLLFAAPVSARLPFLEAVRLEFGGGQLVAVATDRSCWAPRGWSTPPIRAASDGSSGWPVGNGDGQCC
jgi:hypothetical protein